MKGRFTVLEFALSGLLSVAIIGLIAVFAIRAIAEDEALDEAKHLTQVSVAAAIEPGLSEGLVRERPAAVERFDRQLNREALRVAGIERIKLWSADGRVVYSDEPQLIGERFTLGGDEREILRDGGIAAEVSDLDQPENRFERGQGELLEVYMRVETPQGTPLLFESYRPTAAISDTTRELTLAFVPALVGGLLILWLVNLPLARALTRNVQRARREREEYLQAAIEASDRERRRIAADLHDGVVQDMNGLALSVAAEARGAEARGEADAAKRLRRISDAGRQLTRGLRNALVDIYPPTLHREGLAAALDDLAEGAGRRGVTVDLTLADSLDLPPETESLVFRIAQESVRNVLSHAGAERALLSVDREDGRVRIDVRDDGRGFDAEAVSPRGHFGLRALRSLTEDAGGSFELRSRPGEGTEVRAEVPLP
ncbi:MAG: sensor histidine kinase [Solirubrobacterales bacterium]